MDTITNSKSWYASKTVWFNIAIIFGGIATALAGQLQSGSEITIIGIVGIILRTLTSQSLFAEK